MSIRSHITGLSVKRLFHLKKLLNTYISFVCQIQIQIHVFRNKSTSVVFHYYTSINLILVGKLGSQKHTIHKNTCEHSATLHPQHIHLTFTDLDTTNCRSDQTLVIPIVNPPCTGVEFCNFWGSYVKTNDIISFLSKNW